MRCGESGAGGAWQTRTRQALLHYPTRLVTQVRLARALALNTPQRLTREGLNLRRRQQAQLVAIRRSGAAIAAE